MLRNMTHTCTLDESRRETYPLITIGIATKNDEETIAGTLSSLLNVDYPINNLEIVVVDGLSRDRTVEIAGSTLKKALFSWKLLSDESKGLAYARQMVVENARGKYILWVDGDHVIPKNYAKNQVKFMEENPSLGAAEALVVFRGDYIQRLEHYLWFRTNTKRIKMGTKTVGSAGVIYRVEAIKSVGGYDINIKGACEDGDLSKRMFSEGWRFAMNPRAFYYHQARVGWKDLWKQWYWYGYGNHFLNHKHPGSVNVWVHFPIRAFLSGIRVGLVLFRMWRDPACILMPICKIWKTTSWLAGYVRAHRDGYGHNF